MAGPPPDLPSRAGAGGAYWTFAVSELAAFRVKVQLRVLAPALLHTPDQITDRPLVALRVMPVPTGKVAERVVPTGTLSPAGLERTLAPRAAGDHRIAALIGRAATSERAQGPSAPL